MKILSALFLAPLALAATLTGQIAPSNHLPDPSTLPPHTTISLTSPNSHHTTLLTPTSTFRLPHLPPGSYLLTVNSPVYAFAPLRIDVTSDDKISAYQTFKGNAWSNLGPATEVPVVLRAQGKGTVFVEREGFNPVKMVMGNPMLLVAGISMLAVVGLPKLLDKMDPEFKKEFEEHQKKMGGVSGRANDPMGGFDLAGMLAGTAGKQGGAGASGSQAGQGGKAQRRR